MGSAEFLEVMKEEGGTCARMVPGDSTVRFALKKTAVASAVRFPFSSFELGSAKATSRFQGVTSTICGCAIRARLSSLMRVAGDGRKENRALEAAGFGRDGGEGGEGGNPVEGPA